MCLYFQIRPPDVNLKNFSENFLEESLNKENVFHESLLNYQDIEEEEEKEEEEDDDESRNLKVNAVNDAATNDSLYIHFAITCPLCNLEHENYESMLEHLQTHTDNETLFLSCNICNTLCSTVKELLEHMKSHLSQTKPNAYACTQCETSFATAEELKTHEECHAVVSDNTTKKQSEVNYLCNVCGKILKTKDRFRSHKNTHEGLRPHVCLKCGRGFADRKNMHHHYNVVHLRKPKLECPVCQKKFYTRTKMKSHVTMHYGVKPFSCDICSKTFRLKMNMIKHKKTHSNDRPHKCDKCSAAFIDKNMLKRHSYIHGGIRPFPCPVCGHRFSVKFHLKKHLEKSKCSSRALVISEDYQWVGLAQPEANLTGNECVVVYKANDDNLLQGGAETISMNILQEYQEETNS